VNGDSVMSAFARILMRLLSAGAMSLGKSLRCTRMPSQRKRTRKGGLPGWKRLLLAVGLG
jgi:hypothetical protein